MIFKPRRIWRQYGTCLFCGSENVKVVKHHVIPKALLRRSGLSINSSPVVTLCLHCNYRAHHSSPWYRRKMRTFLLEKLRKTEH